MAQERDYHSLIRELLAGVGNGWSYGKVICFLATNDIKEVDISSELRVLAEKLNLDRDVEVIEQIKLLGKMTPGELAEEAFLIGSKIDSSYGQGSELLNCKTWYNRGIYLTSLGDYKEAIFNLKRAIELKRKSSKAFYNQNFDEGELGKYEEALAIACYNRGLALHELGRYPEAIASLDKAIDLKYICSEAWDAKGGVLNKLERYEEAIDCFDRSIEICPEQVESWNRRGIALDKLGKYEEAIASYNKAIEIDPKSYISYTNRGIILKNLGLYQEAITNHDKAIELEYSYSEAWINRGIALDKLGQYQRAIGSYNKAIQFKPSNHQAWLNRGSSIGSRQGFQGYQIQIYAYDEAFQHIKPEIHPEGWGYLQLAIGCRHYQEGKNQLFNHRKDPQPYYKLALTAYNNALQTLTLEHFPALRLETLIDLSKVYLAQKNLELASKIQAEAVDIFHDLLNAQPTVAGKKRLQLKYSGLRQFNVDLFVARGDNIRALEAAELDKNNCLTWLLSGFEDTTISPSFEEMKRLLGSSRKTLEISKIDENPPKSPLQRGTPEAPFVRGLGDSEFETKPEKPTADSTAIVYWHLSAENLTTFILTPTDSQPIVWESDRGRQAREFDDWLKEWDRDYNDYRANKTPDRNHPWRQKITERLAQLSQILEIDKICDRLPPNLTRLMLIPHRDLHRFPLHIFFLTTRKLTKLQGCVYLPSIQIGLNLHQCGSTPPVYTPLLSISDPETEQSELKFAPIESAIVRCLLQSNLNHSHTEIDRQSADVVTVKNALTQPHATFHFTGHAEYDPCNPAVSALALTDGLLTAEEIWQLDLSSYHLVNLPACETAITGRKDIATEYVGLASAFLHAGAANVLSTLWNVDERASTWFTIYFYQQLLAGKSPAVALTITQVWMKNLTWQSLINWLRELSQLPLTNPLIIRNLNAAIETIADREGTIGLERLTEYSNAYYWAAFTLMGRG